ncbi:hypothetical protein KIPB_013373 [Kipferlia bialata]|uniref:ATPase AAA-type core domain-containing protein n=1 Tax=Kipferlia bialata TaxID=797122 RepID=A0A391NS13_9EUKA|nr:hypothetical protein KIPB_013373 [Kipferlia bialata]|eukprot:g13373.t1
MPARSDTSQIKRPPSERPTPPSKRRMPSKDDQPTIVDLETPAVPEGAQEGGVSSFTVHSGIEGPLASANAAVHCGRPLTLLGPPGCGKTALAHHLAQLHGVPLVSLHLSSATDAQVRCGYRVKDSIRS